MILGVHHTSMTTRDVDRLAAFYIDHLGFELVSRSAEARSNPVSNAIFDLPDARVRMTMLKSANSYLELFQFEAPDGRPGEASRPVCDVGVTHICVIVDDCQAEYERLSAAGMRFHCPPQAAGAVGVATYGRDPDGNIVEILQPAADGPFPASALRAPTPA
jgi:catechol 2,3-dioxygenase-like lactoylglutathione lyase family enzyme